jgi:HlyD family secretion protein
MPAIRNHFAYPRPAGRNPAFRLGGKPSCCTGWTQFDEDKAAQISQVITCHIDLILQGLTQRPEVMKKPVAIILVVVVLLAAGVGGWLWYQSHQDKGLTLYGNVDIRTVNMSFRVGGRLASLSVDEGDAIKAGQTLGMLDKAPYENALLQAKANVSVAQAQYDLMLAGYRERDCPGRGGRQTGAGRLRLRAELLRASWGCGKAAPFPPTTWKMRSSRDQAQATLKSAQDKLSQYRTGNRPQDIAQAKASLEQAQAQLAQADWICTIPR